MRKYLFAASAVLATVVGLITGPTSWAKPADLPSNNQIECPDGSDDPVKQKFSIEVDLDLPSKRLTIKVGTAAANPDMPSNIDAVCTTLVPAYFEHLLKLVREAVTAPLEAAGAAEREQKTRELEPRLFDPIIVRVEKVPLKQAIKNLAHVSGLPIVPDYKALKAASINLDAPVTLKVEGTSVHKALRQLLDELQLTYVIEDGMVLITTKENGSGHSTREERVKAVIDAQAQRLFEIGERFRRKGDLEKAQACYQQVHMLSPTSLYGRVAITRLIDIEERMRDAAEEQAIPGRSDDPEQTFRDLRDRSIPLGLVDVSY